MLGPEDGRVLGSLTSTWSCRGRGTTGQGSGKGTGPGAVRLLFPWTGARGGVGAALWGPAEPKVVGVWGRRVAEVELFQFHPRRSSSTLKLKLKSTTITRSS